jgi:hypothetical protein
MLTEWANLSLARAGSDQRVSKMWAYRFEKRLLEHQLLGPVIQKTKDKKQLDMKKIGYLQHWYNQLVNILKDLPSYLVYNFNECSFQPSQEKSWKIISTKKKYPDLTEFDHVKNITAVECIAADGWIMQPLFIFKDKKFIES